jgi:hypothetical protein
MTLFKDVPPPKPKILPAFQKQRARKRQERTPATVLKDQIKDTKQSLTDANRKVAAAKVKLNKLNAVSPLINDEEPIILSFEEVEDYSPRLEAEIKSRPVAFSPNIGPQTDFLAASERQVLYGGAAGGWCKSTQCFPIWVTGYKNNHVNCWNSFGVKLQHS